MTTLRKICMKHLKETMQGCEICGLRAKCGPSGMHLRPDKRAQVSLRLDCAGNVCLAFLIFQMSLTLCLSSWGGGCQMQTVVLVISGSSYIHPGAVERSGEGSVSGHGNVPWPRLWL